LKYPLKKLLSALAAARAARFIIIAYLASKYGRKFLALFGKIHMSLPVTLSITGVLVAAAATAYLVWRLRRRRSRA